MMSFSKTITDDQVVAIGRKFGELRNYICTNKKDSVTHYLIQFYILKMSYRQKGGYSLRSIKMRIKLWKKWEIKKSFTKILRLFPKREFS